MALTKEDLQAIASLMDEKIKPINERLDNMDKRFDGMDKRLDNMDKQISTMNEKLEYLELKEDLTHKKLDDLVLDVKISERSIRKDIKLLQDGQETLITVLESKGILPKVK